MTGGYKLLPSGLAAIETKLGWTLMGKNSSLESRESTALLVTSMICNDTCISNLWSLETIGILDPSEKKTQDELHAAAKENFLRTVRIDDEGRFIVDLPWLSEHPPLPENFELALKRLNNTVKNLKAKNLYEDYDLVFKEWEKEGIIEEVPYNEIQEPSHYLPHRPVVKENSTTRIRPVFDASAKSRSSPSLNDCLEKGMNLIEFIPSILTRFRMYKIGVTADICKAFLQIRVSERDKNYLRFLWYNDKSELKYFRHCRVIFGASCSPFLLGSVVQYHLESALEEARVESSKYPVETVEELANSFYVDNCLVSVKDEAQLHKFMQAATEILMERKFELRGWEYSDSRCQVSEPTNMLGMMWDRGNDTLSLKLSHDTDTSSMKISKRSILSAAHKTFDPLGIVCPVTLLPKLLLQRLWECKLTWDQEVDTNIEEEFLKWLKNLETLKELKITRWLQCEYVIDSLHFFCDASKSAYSAVVFIKICLNDSVAVHLLRAKSRIAPCGKKETTIARLELLGATILARLSVEVLKEFKKEKIVFWTDSTTVLSWLRREGPWGVFVQNRVQEIRSLTPLNAWRFVPGSLNPADLPSRGCSARQLLSSKWWEGPQWLYFPSEEWPKDEFCVDEEEIQSERKRGVVSSMVNMQCTDNICDVAAPVICDIMKTSLLHLIVTSTPP
ncbi:uncharacterized protein LOC129226934 [Uloborus diversus]|uniref:uncharacterized protein LOC129226934 n=1 Tax=Uloborus diversus TaxID=327109 RepID=UPI002409FFFA|nr:uncharacterized protein LOC129226934 [Uloborus diversus]